MPQPSKSNKNNLSPEQSKALLKTLKDRFEKNMGRHKGLAWAQVQAKLEASADKLWSLQEMERTGGEPDVVGQDKQTGGYVFYDCAAESPKERRSVCYDRELGEFDTKTSSWVNTPADVRKLGGALFCDRRFNTVFVYHNGAESYYAARGFRGSLKV